MKPFICILPIVIVVSFNFTYCSDTPRVNSVSAEDSLRIISNYLKKTDTISPKNVYTPQFFDFATAKNDPDPIPEPVAMAMINSYRDYHDLGLKNEDGDRLQGFVIKSADFKNIITAAARYSSVALYFGVKNHTETTPGKGQYTMVIVPIDKNSRAIRTEVVDYVLPCPKYCPINGF